VSQSYNIFNLKEPLVRIPVFFVVLHHWISVPDVSEELLA